MESRAPAEEEEADGHNKTVVVMGSRAPAEEEEEEDDGSSKARLSCDPRVLCLYGDVLEAVALRARTLDLVSASRVSREWRRTVRSALRLRPRRSPWLVLRLHCPSSASTSLCGSTLLAYDPYSRTWLPPLQHVRPPPLPHLPLPRASPALHAASLSAMAISRDPFGATWRAMEAPRVWRVDPVVAATAGGHVAVIGGACQLALGEGEDVGAVEVLGPGSDGWEACDPMPAAFEGSKSATWLSAATSDRRVYVTDKTRGWTSWFEPETKRWGPTLQLRPDPTAASFAIGIRSSSDNDDNDDNFNNDPRLVLATAGRSEGKVEVKLWDADAETLELVQKEGVAAAAAAMPKEFAKRMFQDEDVESESESESEEHQDRSWEISSTLSVGLCSRGDAGYVYNGSDPRKGVARFYYEDGKSGSCKWEWIGVPVMMQKEKAMDRVVVVGCAVVGLDDLAVFFPC